VIVSAVVAGRYYKLPSMAAYEQVVIDWNTKPLVDIKIQASACKGDYDTDVFSKSWKGMDEGCI